MEFMWGVILASSPGPIFILKLAGTKNNFNIKIGPGDEARSHICLEGIAQLCPGLHYKCIEFDALTINHN